MMFLSKSDQEELMTPKQKYLIKYLFGDYATHQYKDRIKFLEMKFSEHKSEKKELYQELKDKICLCISFISKLSGKQDTRCEEEEEEPANEKAGLVERLGQVELML